MSPTARYLRSMATLTITLSDEVLKTLREARSLSVVLAASGASKAGGGRAGSSRPAARGNQAGGNGAFRAGSLPDRLLKWADGRKGPFGVSDVMGALKVKRSHASMVLTSARKKRAVKRVGRGSYAVVRAGDPS